MAGREDRSIVVEDKDAKGSLVVLGGFASVLFWWIGIYGYVSVGGFQSGAAGFLTFLALPVLATAATYRFARRHNRFGHGSGIARHRLT